MARLCHAVLLPDGSDSQVDEAFFFKPDRFLGLNPIAPPNPAGWLRPIGGVRPEAH
jgi:hypothetical protein